MKAFAKKTIFNDGFVYWLIVGSLVFAGIGSAMLMAYIKKGQFEENEEVKYQIFFDDDE